MEHIQKLPTQDLCAAIQYLALKGQDITQHFLEYFKRTGIDQAYNLLPYNPQDTIGHPDKMAANRRVNRAVHQARVHMRQILMERTPEPFKGVVGAMSLGGERGSIRYDADDLPRAKLCVDYSGAPLQGQYMGSKTKHLTRRKERVFFGQS